ncbi:MAG: 50S ribosomal protein L24 [Bacteroidales bacterium]|nr:50S ribosomal protein L24 [Bacteroidales bacterium]
MTKLFVKKGDNVKVLSGESKGKTGRVLSVNVEKQRAVVEGVNLVSKHARPSTENPKGGIVKKEAGIHVSNLMVVDSKGIPSRLGRKKDENGKSVRYSKKTGETIK